jgi:hypothetical protein
MLYQEWRGMTWPPRSPGLTPTAFCWRDFGNWETENLKFFSKVEHRLVNNNIVHDEFSKRLPGHWRPHNLFSEINALDAPRYFLVRLCQKCPVWVYWAGGQLGWTETADNCRCWNSNTRDAEVCMGWNKLSTRRLSRHERYASGNLRTDTCWVNLHFNSLFFLVCIMVEEVYLPRTPKWLYIHSVL